MKQNSKNVREMPAWVVVAVIMMAFGCFIVLLYLHVDILAVKRDTEFSLFGLVPPKLKHRQAWQIGACVCPLLSLAWLIWRYDPPGKRIKRYVSLAFAMIVGTVVLVRMVGHTYEQTLAQQGVGTMQTALDTEYYQEEMKLMGNLGVYGGKMTLDGEPGIYLCRQMDTFGPFATQVLADTATQPFSKGYEEYSRFEQDGLVQFHALSVQHYQDGYWLVVKRFVNINDLLIEIDHLDDLRRYIVQMQYARHDGDEASVAREFEETAGEAVTRTR